MWRAKEGSAGGKKSTAAQRTGSCVNRDHGGAALPGNAAPTSVCPSLSQTLPAPVGTLCGRHHTKWAVASVWYFLRTYRDAYLHGAGVLRRDLLLVSISLRSRTQKHKSQAPPSRSSVLWGEARCETTSNLLRAGWTVGPRAHVPSGGGEVLSREMDSTRGQRIGLKLR